MKKITGIVLAMIMAGVVLTGCYNKACGEPCCEKATPTCYKGENR